MLKDYAFMIKENSHYNLTSRLDSADFFSELENQYVCIHLLLGKDAPKLHQRLYQSLKNSNYLQSSILNNNIRQFLLAFFLIR